MTNDSLKNIVNSEEFKKEEHMAFILGYGFNFDKTKNNISNIQKIISEDNTDNKLKEKILTQLIRLSPKKTGLFYETFNRYNNDLLPSNDTFFDALTKSGKRVEIKASRALRFVENKPDNLFEQLVESGSEFIPFEECLTTKFDCNIQQVKTNEFDTLNYCIFFSDVIVEFSMNNSDIKNNNVENAIHKLTKDLSQLSSSDSKKVLSRLEKLDWKNTFRLNTFVKEFTEAFKGVKDPMVVDLFKGSGVLSGAYKNFRLGYSDKQHKGNIGEGQFHITNKNFLFHLENNFVKAYSYKDFIDVLKNTKACKEKDEAKIKPTF